MTDFQAPQPAHAAHLVMQPAGADVYVHGVKVPDFPIGTAADPRRQAFVDAVNQAARAAIPAPEGGEREALQKILMGFSILDDGPDDSDVAHANRLIAEGVILGRAAQAAPALTEQDREDAARFRWLIDDKNCDETNDTPMVCTSEDVHWGDKARALIDRHMKKD